MATSISDLLTVLDHASTSRAGHDPGDAARALDHSARLLTRLRNDGVGAATSQLRDDTTRRLAEACADAAVTFESGPGRMGDLVGVTSDSVGRLRAELTDDDRWTVAAALASATRRCAGIIAHSGPYGRVPQLLEVAARSRELTRAAVMYPAHPARLIGHDLQIPTSLLPRDASPARVAAESMAQLLASFRAAGREPISVGALLGACYAGEAVARAGALTAGTRLLGPRPEVVQAWQRLRAELARFTDRPRRNTELAEPMLRHALRIHDELQDAPGYLSPGRVEARRVLGADSELLRRTVLMLPALAGGIFEQLHRPTAWIAAGGPRPLHEDRVGEWLHHKPFLARDEDLYRTISALHRATHETNQLITALSTQDRLTTSGGSLTRARTGTAPSRL